MSDDPKTLIRESYARIARNGGSCASASAGCCGSPASASERLGYSGDDLEAAPTGSDLGLGCGNPTALASLKAGEVVIDLGSGAGLDCFIAAKRVGPSGRVIGVDMTPEMLAKARSNAARNGFTNVEFRLGEIENLPVDRDAADIILSNCVINLSADKARVYREAWRVLKPGGRLAVSDVVAIAPLPEELRNDPRALAGCIAGAASPGSVRRWLGEAGFSEIQVTIDEGSRDFIRDWVPGAGLERFVASAMIQAVKSRA